MAGLLPRVKATSSPNWERIGIKKLRRRKGHIEHESRELAERTGGFNLPFPAT
jgi:hypothetical protein